MKQRAGGFGQNTVVFDRVNSPFIMHAISNEALCGNDRPVIFVTKNEVRKKIKVFFALFNI